MQAISMTKQAHTLPTLTLGQSFCCENGCGVTMPKSHEFEYSREEDRHCSLIERKTRPIWVSACCGASVFVHDEKDDSWTERETPGLYPA